MSLIFLQHALAALRFPLRDAAGRSDNRRPCSNSQTANSQVADKPAFYSIQTIVRSTFPRPIHFHQDFHPGLLNDLLSALAKEKSRESEQER